MAQQPLTGLVGWRIGEVDGGWRVMMASLQEEHSGAFAARIARLLDEAEAGGGAGRQPASAHLNAIALPPVSLI